MQIQESIAQDPKIINSIRERVRHLAVTLSVWLKNCSDQRDIGSDGK